MYTFLSITHKCKDNVAFRIVVIGHSAVVTFHSDHRVFEVRDYWSIWDMWLLDYWRIFSHYVVIQHLMTSDVLDDDIYVTIWHFMTSEVLNDDIYVTIWHFITFKVLDDDIVWKLSHIPKISNSPLPQTSIVTYHCDLSQYMCTHSYRSHTNVKTMWLSV